ncbi:MAG: ABC transporter ATP-binding protein [Elusimicrobia bacterium]|nr:ABC transporter ATP-binding protein [Elusimicrobiota bacterium]
MNAIQVDGLFKRYRIGLKEEMKKTLVETLLSWGKAPLSQYRRLRRLSRFEEGDDGEDVLWALRGLSFQVEEGEVLGIVGRNGAGKSTLLKILSRITEPTAGRARLRGRVASLLEVGTGFHPELTGRENVYLNGAILGMSKKEIDRKFDEIVAFAEIVRFIDTPVKHYSSGMRVRLAFAVAAHLEPEILLVDEVLAVGDAAFQKKSVGKMQEVSKQGRTVLLVSHSMPSIANLCHRAILLNDGQIEAEGPSHEVIRHYLSKVQSGEGEASWSDPSQAPGTEEARLRSVRILQEGSDRALSTVDISKEVLVEISFWNFQDNAMIHPAIWLKDQLGTFVLASGNGKSMTVGEDPLSGKPYPRGLFRSVCRIPGNFLNEGRYNITAIIGNSHNQSLVLQQDVVCFDVQDTGEMRKEYLGSWAGPVVRPKLGWRTERVGA